MGRGIEKGTCNQQVPLILGREDATMKNPVTAVREEMGLSRQQFALALGVSYSVLAAHEVGLPARMAPQVRRGLDRLGLDGERLAQDYAAWREQAGEIARARERG